MAAGSSLPCEERFLCSICLDVFSQPVSTPCGHNYCKACITGYWDRSDLARCPICMENFGSRPQLQVNTGFRDMVEHFNSLRAAADEMPVKLGEVPCDICLGPKLRAQKTCLVCLASYCESHLEPHLRVASLKKHELSEPMSNLEDRVCKRHDKMLELFCQTDQVCICFMCLKDDHAAHEAVPLKQAHGEKTAQLQREATGMKMTEEAKSNTVKLVKDSIRRSKEESDSDVSSINAFFAALAASLKCRQAELIEVIQEKQKAAEAEAVGFVAQLEQELTKLRRTRSKMEQLLQTKDHLHLLQSWPSLQIPAHTEDLFSPMPIQLLDNSPQIYAGIVRNAVDRMEKALNNEMELLFHEVSLSDSSEVLNQAVADEIPMAYLMSLQSMLEPEDKLSMIQQSHAVNVTMNKYTYSPGLAVSEDGKRLSFLDTVWFYPPDVPNSNAEPPLVHATEGYSSGKFYYEVQVRGVDNFWVGVVNPTVSNKGRWILASYKTSWGCVSVIDASHEEIVFLESKPERVGVFVDCDNGEVSFFDVDARTLIYSITRCNFTSASMLESFFRSMSSGGSNQRPKLYPAFSIFGCQSSSELVITPVAHAP